MTAPELLVELQRRGVTLKASVPGKLHFSAPVGAVDSELRRQMSEHKNALLDLLCEGPASTATPPVRVPDEPRNGQPEIERVAGRAERCEKDCDTSPPSPVEYLERQRRLASEQSVGAFTERVAETHLRLDRLAAPQSASQLKAMELVRTCREHGVGLRLDPDGALVVISNGAAWRALVAEIELHIDQIVMLLISGWDPTNA